MARSSTIKFIPAKWPGRCAKCGEPFAAGAFIWHQKKGVQWHQDCAPVDEATKDRASAYEASATSQSSTIMDALPQTWDPQWSPDLAPWGVPHVRIDSVTQLQCTKIAAINEHHARFEIFGAKAVGHADPRHALEWLGVESYREAIRVCREGWPEGVARMQSLADSIDVPAMVSTARRRTRCDQGDAVDIHRVLSGRLDTAWERTRRASVVAPEPITLLFKIGANWMTTAEELFWRGAAMLAAANLIESAGYSLEIMGVHWINDARLDKDSSAPFNSWSAEFPIKPRHAPIELNSLSTVCALSGFYRIFGFALDMSIPVPVAKNLGVSELRAAHIMAPYIARRDRCRAIAVDVASISSYDTARAEVQRIIASIEEPQQMAA